MGLFFIFLEVSVGFICIYIYTYKIKKRKTKQFGDHRTTRWLNYDLNPGPSDLDSMFLINYLFIQLSL